MATLQSSLESQQRQLQELQQNVESKNVLDAMSDLFDFVFRAN